MPLADARANSNRNADPEEFSARDTSAAFGGFPLVGDARECGARVLIRLPLRANER
jgi:hypothetical protein